MITQEECVKSGLLRKIAPSIQQANEQLEKAQVLLVEAKKSLTVENPNSAVMAAYTAALDAGRALLFKDGWRERSHACVARYLEYAYKKEMGELIYLLDEYREQRHKTTYAGSYYATMDEARKIVGFAEKFLAKTEQILRK